MNHTTTTSTSNQQEQVLVQIPLDTYLELDTNNQSIREKIKPTKTGPWTNSTIHQLKKIPKRNVNTTSNITPSATSTEQEQQRQPKTNNRSTTLSSSSKGSIPQPTDSRSNESPSVLSSPIRSTITLRPSHPTTPSNKRKRSPLPTSQSSSSSSKKTWKANQVLNSDQITEQAEVLSSAARVAPTDDANGLNRRQMYAEYCLEWRLRCAVELILGDIETKFV